MEDQLNNVSYKVYIKAMPSASHRLYYLNAIFTVSQKGLRTDATTNIFLIRI